MAVPIESLGICYFPVPKVANTSVKHLLFQIENGCSFFEATEQRKRGEPKAIHREYPTVLFNKEELASVENMLRFTVVRDPLHRLVSCWRNRVVYHEELSPAKVSMKDLKKADLPPTPDLNTFALNIEKYRQVKKSIDTHARPLVDFLGTDDSYFHMIFSIEKIDLLEKFLQSLAGTDAILKQRQTGGPEANADDLSDAAKRHLQKVYEQDYDVFGKYFTSPGGVVSKPLLVKKKDTPTTNPQPDRRPKGVDFHPAMLAVTKTVKGKCPACGAKDLMSQVKYPSTFSEWGKLDINICNACGYGFVPKLHFDLDAYYREEYGAAPVTSRKKYAEPGLFFDQIDTNRLRVVNRARAQAGIIKALDLKPQKVLDFGPGVGALFHYLKPKTAFAVEGDDVCFPYLDHLGVKRVDMDKAFEAAQDPDLIVASHFLEHLTADYLDTFLTACHKTMGSKGSALFEVPEWGWVQHRELPPRGGHEPHTIFFSVDSFVQVLRNNGFKFRYLSIINFIYDLNSEGYPALDEKGKVQMLGQPKRRGDGTHLLAVVTPS